MPDIVPSLALPTPASDLGERVPAAFADKAKASAWLDGLKGTLPAAPPAYVPSGRMPGKALVSLLAGSVLGVPVGAAVGAIAATLATLLLGVVWAGLASVWSGAGQVVRFLIVMVAGGFALKVSFYCLITPAVSIGVATAATTAGLGARAHNRSVGAARLFAIGSTVAALAALEAIGKALDPSALAGVSETARRIGLVVAGILAVCAAGGAAAERVRATKYCEGCARPMDPVGAPTPLGLATLRAVVDALGAGRLDDAGAWVRGGAGIADGDAQRFACPSCGAGFLDVRAHPTVTWNDGKRQDTWLVASRALTADDGARFEAGLRAPRRLASVVEAAAASGAA
jgi:hypothetical protein